MPTRVRPLLRVRSLGTAVQCSLGVVIAVTVFSAWSTWNRRSFLVDVREGRDRITPASADEVDSLVQAAGILALLLLVVTAVLWVIWFQRAYKNVSTVHDVEHGTGWAIGAWFVPFLNLVRPFQMAREIVVETPSPRLTKAPALLGWWWGTWLISGMLSRFGFSRDPESLDALVTSDTVSTCSDVVSIVAAVLAILVVRRITRAQLVRFGALVT